MGCDVTEGGNSYWDSTNCRDSTLPRVSRRGVTLPSVPMAVVDIGAIVTRDGFASREPRLSSVDDPLPHLVNALGRLLGADPAIFLERYGSHLTEEELESFDALAYDSYEVRWHLASLRKTGVEAAQKRRNRRFRKLRELELSSDFFSDTNMQQRAPALFHTYLGRLLPTDPSGASFDDDTPLSERLLANVDADERSRRVAEAAAAMERSDDGEEEEEEEEEEAAEEAAEEGEGDGEDEELEGEEVDDESDASERYAAGVVPGAGVSPTHIDATDYEAQGFRVLEEERRQGVAVEGRRPRQQRGGRGGGRGRREPAALPQSSAAGRQHAIQRAREELLTVMRERFLAGEEGEYFEYATCDNNPRYDDIEQEARDAEERWFDEDD